MMLMFEIAGPFRPKPVVERVGPLTRVIWMWFSVAYLGAGFNDVWRAMREHERKECASLCEQIVRHPAGYGGQWEGYGPVMTTRDGAACAAAIRERSARP